MYLPDGTSLRWITLAHVTAVELTGLMTGIVEQWSGDPHEEGFVSRRLLRNHLVVPGDQAELPLLYY